MLKYWIEPTKFDAVFSGFILPDERLPLLPDVTAEEYLHDIACIAEEMKRQALNSKPLIIKPKKADIQGVLSWSEGLVEIKVPKEIITQKAKSVTRAARRIYTEEDVRTITAAMYMETKKDFDSEEDRLLEIQIALAKADEIIEKYNDYENEV